MNDDDARALLGVASDASPEAVRRAYHRLVLAHHPDVTGSAVDATARTAEINRAYVVVTTARANQAPAVHAPVPAADRTMTVTAGSTDVFTQLCEAADTIGTLGYVDRGDGIIESIIRPPGGPTCSLLLAIDEQGGQTLAHCTLESLESRPGPPIEEVVAALDDALSAGRPG